MRKKTSIAILTACMMLFTLIPGAAFAGADNTKGISASSITKKKTEPSQKFRKAQLKAQLTGYLDDFAQMVLEELEFEYEICIEKESRYIPEIWAEIQKAYEDGRAAVVNAKTFYELLDAYYKTSEYLWNLGELTKRVVKSNKDLPKLKKMYNSSLDSEYRYLKKQKKKYNSYYWSLIEDARYMGKKNVNAAKTFGDVTWVYWEASYAFDEVWTKSELAALRKGLALEFNRYVNLALNAKDYDTATWAKIKDIRSKAVASIMKQTSADGIDQTFQNTQEALVAKTGVEFFSMVAVEDFWFGDEEDWDDEEYDDEDYEEEEDFYLYYELYEYGMYYPYLMERLIKLDNAFEAYDAYLYSENGYWELEERYEEAFINLAKSSTKTGANKAYAAGIKKMKAVPDMEKEIATFKVQKPKGLKATKKKSTYVQLKWKAVKNAEGYYIYKKTKSGKYKKVGTTYGKSYKVKKLKGNKTYRFKVRAFNSEIDYVNVYYSKYSKTLKVKTPKK